MTVRRVSKLELPELIEQLVDRVQTGEYQPREEFELADLPMDDLPLPRDLRTVDENHRILRARALAIRDERVERCRALSVELAPRLGRPEQEQWAPTRRNDAEAYVLWHYRGCGVYLELRPYPKRGPLALLVGVSLPMTLPPD